MYVCMLGYRLVREADGGNTIQGLSSSDLHFLWGYVDVGYRWNKRLLGRLYFIISFCCMYGLIFQTYIVHLLGASKSIKLTEGLETLFSWCWGTPLPITLVFWGKPCHLILKQINHFAWRQVCPLNHFSCTKFYHLR